jgi:hypothetical protein
MLSIDLRGDSYTCTYTESDPNVTLIKRDGTLLDLQRGFVELPAESVVRLPNSHRYPQLQVCLIELQSLFVGSANRLSTYRRHFQQNTFCLSESNIRTRIILMLYSMWLVTGWVTDDSITELAILSHLLYIITTWRSESLDEFITYLNNMGEREREALAALLADAHIGAMTAGPQSWPRRYYKISLDPSYFMRCMAGEAKLKRACEEIIKSNIQTRTIKYTQEFEKTHDLFALWTLEKAGRYQDSVEWCARYIDDALILISNIGGAGNSQIRLAYVYDRISMGLIRLDDKKGAYEQLSRLLSLPKAVWGPRSRTEDDVLVRRYKRLRKQFK